MTWEKREPKMGEKTCVLLTYNEGEKMLLGEISEQRAEQSEI